MAEVTIRDVRKSYDTLEVLHGVDVTIADGEFVVLVGPSGCGKSTLQRIQYFSCSKIYDGLCLKSLILSVGW